MIAARRMAIKRDVGCRRSSQFPFHFSFGQGQVVSQRSTIGIRRLFFGAYGALLASCALVAVLWAGSHRSVAQLRLPVVEGGTRWAFTSYRGILSIALIDNHPTDEPIMARARRDDPDTAFLWDDHSWTNSWAGLSMEDAQIWVAAGNDRRVPRHWTSVNIPYWFLFALTCAGPLHGIYIVCRAYRRVSHDQCGVCGYELGGGTTCQACAARAALIGASPRVRLVRTA
jgi:hypothetical protein